MALPSCSRFALPLFQGVTRFWVAMGRNRMTERRLLSSWKEIADYMGRGVRTVQRYERELGLPVHRVAGRQRGSVMAFLDEIEGWVRNTPPDLHVLSPYTDGSSGTFETKVFSMRTQSAAELQRAREHMECAIAAYQRCLKRYKALNHRGAAQSA